MSKVKLQRKYGKHDLMNSDKPDIKKQEILQISVFERCLLCRSDIHSNNRKCKGAYDS